MLTLYAPVAGRVCEASEMERSVTIVADAAGPVHAPTRGTVSECSASGLVITDLRGRSVRLIFSDAARPLVTDGDVLTFDQPVFEVDPGARVAVVSVGAAEVLLHVAVGSSVAQGADLLSVGPFACGVS